ncbi:MAG TPA: TolC family protein [Gemmatimonadales bacterium]
MLLLLAAGSLLIQAPIPDSLTLAQALSQARSARGQVMTATARVAAARAGFRQAGTIPNPTGNYEYTEDTPRQHLTFDQSFDWLLTRGPSRDAANASITGAIADSAQLEADLAAEVRRAFYSLVAARQLHALVVAQAATADTLADIAEHRFKSGDISRFEADAALLEAQRVRLNLSRAREVETVAGAEFSRTLGLSEVTRVPVAAGRLDEGLDGPSMILAPIEAEIPGIQRATAESTAATLRLRATKRAWIPLPSVIAGAEWSDPGSPGETLGLIGVSLPLPLWNQGGGNSAAALSEADIAAAGAREARLAAKASLASAETRLAEAAGRARLSRDSLFPAAGRLRQQATLAYQAGETGILPVIEALRAEREISASTVDELLSFQEAVAEWNRLAGVAR